MLSRLGLATSLVTALAVPAIAQTAAAPAASEAAAPSANAAAAPSASESAPGAATAASRAYQMPPAIDLMSVIASSFDTDADGKISQDEFAQFSADTWFSKDTNSDKAISPEEFQSWDFGFEYIAAQKGNADRYAQIKTDLFSYWDRNADKSITPDEVEAVAKSEFANSDPDGDGFVTGRDLAFGSPSFNAAIFGLR